MILICHCDACNYTFNASALPPANRQTTAHSQKRCIPHRCPDCGKMSIHIGFDTAPAVREATEAEIAEYYENRRIVLDEIAAGVIDD